MPSFLFRASHAELKVEEISLLRRISPYSISEIRQRAREGSPLLDIALLSGDWPAGKNALITLLDEIGKGQMPLTVHLLCLGEEESHTAASALQALAQLQHIEAGQNKQGLDEVSNSTDFDMPIC